MLKSKLERADNMLGDLGNNLKRFRLLNDLSLQDVGEKLNLSAPAISKYEKGEVTPNSNRLIEFSRIYNVGVAELMKVYTIPNMEFNSFRKKKRLTGQRLELLKSLIQNEVAKYLEVLNLNNYVIPDNYKITRIKCGTVDAAENIAKQFRVNRKISELIPISNLTHVLENFGIFVIYINNINHEFDDFDGLSEIVSGIPFIVVLDDINDGARQRFTIAHELGHLLLDIAENANKEKLCHRFASALLMPKEAIINEFGNSRTHISFLELEAIKREYKVSYSAIIYRLEDLDIITRSNAKYWYIQLNKMFGKIDPDPIPREKSNQFEKLVSKLEANKIISNRKASEYLDIPEDEYNKKNHINGY